MKKLIFLGSGILLIMAVAFFMFSSIMGEVIENSQETINIPLSEISTQAQWYEYNSRNTKIKYFAVKASDGTIKTAFDACDVCFGSKRGYSQDGDVMICNNCGNRYPIMGLGTENLRGGGCWPSYLPSEADGENLIIKVSDLKRGERLFR